MTDPTPDPIVAFLETRLAEDEQTARAATPGPWQVRPEPRSAHSTLFGEADVSGPDGRMVAADSDGGCADMVDAVHIARHDPARVLADVAAKRAIVTLHGRPHECAGFYDEGRRVNESYWCVAAEDCDTLLALARVHADHPDFDPSWLP